MHWVLDTLSVYLALAVLILFQDDIRRALAGAGAGRSHGTSTLASDGKRASTDSICWIESTS